jgi:hypothetical protein
MLLITSIIIASVNPSAWASLWADFVTRTPSSVENCFLNAARS